VDSRYPLFIHERPVKALIVLDDVFGTFDPDLGVLARHHLGLAFDQDRALRIAAYPGTVR
jgi:hypothetical protein